MKHGEMQTSSAPSPSEPPIGVWTSRVSQDQVPHGTARQARVQHGLEPPWNAIAEVVARFEFPGRDSIEIAGSGWLCAPDLILTAAHLLHAHLPDGRSRRASSVRVRIGTGAGAGPMSLRTQIAPEDILVPGAFVCAGHPVARQDYAVLRVRNSRLAAIAPAPVPLSSDIPGPAEPVTLSGLVREPGHRTARLSAGEAPLKRATTFDLTYPIAGRPGQEGGPILMRQPSEPSKWLAIGVHLRATPMGGLARRIDSELAARVSRLQDAGSD